LVAVFFDFVFLDFVFLGEAFLVFLGIVFFDLAFLGAAFADFVLVDFFVADFVFLEDFAAGLALLVLPRLVPAALGALAGCCALAPIVESADFIGTAGAGASGSGGNCPVHSIDS
jgi:hypothetical protein